MRGFRKEETGRSCEAPREGKMEETNMSAIFRTAVVSAAVLAFLMVPAWAQEGSNGQQGPQGPQGDSQTPPAGGDAKHEVQEKREERREDVRDRREDRRELKKDTREVREDRREVKKDVKEL